MWEAINWVAVVAATVASFAFGALWYSPLLFLAAWGRESGVDTAAAVSNPVTVFGVSFALTALGAVVLSWILGSEPGVVRGATLGMALGVGLAAASLGINYQFAGRSTGLWLIDGGFHVLRITLMGVVIGFIQ